MGKSGWHLFMQKRHRRGQVLRQLFFTSWGLMFAIILTASPFVFKNVSWAILDVIDISSIQTNNMRVINMRLNGIDKNGEPFSLRAKTALQKFSEPDVIHLDAPIADISRLKNGRIVREHIAADSGRFLNETQIIVLSGNAVITSGDGSVAKAKTMEINLRE